MIVIHISQQRFDFIKSLGYGFREDEYFFGDGVGGPSETEAPDSCVYHTLDDEYAFCVSCNAAFDSVDANTPAEMETIKSCPERAAIALRNMRQENAVHYKELCLRNQ